MKKPSIIAAFGTAMAFAAMVGTYNASALEVQKIPDKYLADKMPEHANYKLTACEPLTGEGIEGKICTGLYWVSDVNYNQGRTVEQCADISIFNTRKEEVFKSTYCEDHTYGKNGGRFTPLSLKEWSQLSAVKSVMADPELKKKMEAPYRPPLLGG